MPYPRNPSLYPDGASFSDRVAIIVSNGELTERQTQVSLLHIEGCDHNEIALVLGVAPDTAREHARRARTRMGVKDGRDLALLMLARLWRSFLVGSGERK